MLFINSFKIGIPILIYPSNNTYITLKINVIQKPCFISYYRNPIFLSILLIIIFVKIDSLFGYKATAEKLQFHKQL